MIAVHEKTTHVVFFYYTKSSCINLLFVYGTKQPCIDCKKRETFGMKKISVAAMMIALGIAVCAFTEHAGYVTGDTMAHHTITMAGSSSMEKFANALAEGFMTKHPNVTVTAEFTGSSAGVESVLAGTVDIGNSSRSLSEEEKYAGAVENIVAIDGIVIITDISNLVTSLSTEQLIGIYQGDIRNWSEVGGVDMAIVVVGREAGSGTRDTFEELLGIRDMCAYANELNSVGAVKTRVALTPGAIGYVSQYVLDDKVQVLSLDGIEPVEDNIKSGKYPLSRPFIMVTNGEIPEQSEMVQEIFTYLKSEEGQEVIRTVGLIVPD